MVIALRCYVTRSIDIVIIVVITVIIYDKRDKRVLPCNERLNFQIVQYKNVLARYDFVQCN